MCHLPMTSKRKLCFNTQTFFKGFEFRLRTEKPSSHAKMMTKQIIQKIKNIKDVSCLGVELLCLLLSDKQLKGNVVQVHGWHSDLAWPKETLSVDVSI